MSSPSARSATAAACACAACASAPACATSRASSGASHVGGQLADVGTSPGCRFQAVSPAAQAISRAAPVTVCFCVRLPRSSAVKPAAFAWQVNQGRDMQAVQPPCS